MKIQKLYESYVEDEAQAYATLLTLEEVQKLPSSIRSLEVTDTNDKGRFYWTSTPNKDLHTILVVAGTNGYVGYDMGGNYPTTLSYVRPAIKFLDDLNQPVGTKFYFGHRIFQVVDKNTAFCLEDIGKQQFDENGRRDYDTSTVKKYIDTWFEKAWKEATKNQQ